MKPPMPACDPFACASENAAPSHAGFGLMLTSGGPYWSQVEKSCNTRMLDPDNVRVADFGSATRIQILRSVMGIEAKSLVCLTSLCLTEISLAPTGIEVPCGRVLNTRSAVKQVQS